MFSKLCLGLVSFVAFGLITPASASDWHGCYGGLSVGGGVGNNKGVYDPTDHAFGSSTAHGLLGGGQLGCDWREDMLVFGVQGMLSASNIQGSNFYEGGSGANNTVRYQMQWLATVTGRAGYLADENTLLYGKGGIAYGHFDFKDRDPDTPYVGPADWTAAGLLIGAGVERQISQNISLSAEYNYIDFGKEDVTITYSNSATPVDNTFDQSLHQVVVGMNYRF